MSSPFVDNFTKHSGSVWTITTEPFAEQIKEISQFLSRQIPTESRSNFISKFSRPVEDFEEGEDLPDEVNEKRRDNRNKVIDELLDELRQIQLVDATEKGM
jgi:hypothetical protein